MFNLLKSSKSKTKLNMQPKSNCEELLSVVSSAVMLYMENVLLVCCMVQNLKTKR